MSYSDICARRATERIEDLEWMARSGETREGAARRLGMNHDSLERWALRHAHEIWHQLRLNDRSIA